MKSIKPGRGEAMVSGAVSLIVALVGVLWTIGAVSMGAGFMAFFGVAFIVIALVNACADFYNATAEKRMSLVDVVDAREEPDPLNERFGSSAHAVQATRTAAAYCPYCGTPTEPDYAFCPRCGKALRKA
ncbi:MAG: zinc-ribbon domain-containing protein [Aristaeellaceae bacterium]